MEDFKETLAQLYIGYFGRAPEPEGLAFWEEALEDGFSVQAAAQDFASQPETLAQYPYLEDPDSSDLGTFLSIVYNNLFGRAPDTAGLAFWSDAIEAGLPVGTAILNIIAGAQGDDVNTLENKVNLALRWPELANAETDFELTPEGIASSRAALALVTSDPASIGPDSPARNALDNFFNDAPSLTLTNTIDSLSEDANTSSRIQVAEISISDDGLGQNTLSLSGDDAAMFEIEGNKLYLRAGARLDFETAASLNIVVNIDDLGISGSPDDNSAFNLTITDVPETPSGGGTTQPLQIDRSTSTSDEEITLSGNRATFIQTGTGNDSITAGDGSNNINAGGGDNTVVTGTGVDTIVTGDGNDTVDSGGGDDTVTIGDGDDVVRAGEGADHVIAGNGGGDDFIDGGPGNDTVSYPSLTSTEPVRIDLNEVDRSTDPVVAGILTQAGLATNTPVGTTTGGAWVGTDVLISIESAAGGAGNDTILGSDEANDVSGAGGDDSLQGGAGTDRLNGGEGADILDGGADGDMLIGGSGNDTVFGGLGYDTLILSGAHTDYTFVSNRDGTYTVTDSRAVGDGIDIISSVEQISFSNTTLGLWSIVGFIEIPGTTASERLEGTPGRDFITGDDGDDLLLGFEEEDILSGGRGNDTLDGGLGSIDDSNGIWDTADYIAEYFDGGTQGVTVNLQTGIATDAYGGTDTLREIERVYGTNYNDVLIGSDETDTGEAYDPHGGDDTIHGGGGEDRLHYHLSRGVGGLDGITVQFDLNIEGSGVVSSDPFGDTDTFTGIRELRATSSADTIMGGAGRQIIATLDGADTIDGGAGQDEIRYDQDANYGGTLALNLDMEIVDTNGYATATDGWGKDDLIRNVEDIRGTGSADFIGGDSAENNFRGRAGDDILAGRGGNDTLQGENGADSLDGGSGADILLGGSGNDSITGGSGDDWMRGDLDADMFIFNTGDGNDTIADFVVGEDMLSLQTGLTITSHTEADVDSAAGLDTILTLSSNDTITLSGVTGISDTSLLF
ncbi:hypothetical protein A3734_13050 [Sulfitobacter sp. HI0054]|uniref:DUF4214 domain-containing protein n=1 Tax=Sulfitobacter sp. HI0054 TaxID=1822238 RepID=UPI0007C21C46|nr:DUF4214 domain-containing protein [Sulfitobacter sp. HI0054]KZY54165.1 hypothetical protein A3734_13050 [Sulfitobacter sp. HI0054]